MILRFKVMWLGYEKAMLKFVGMVLILNVSNENIRKHFQ